jgi:soluble lytic murein transglycosylase-like protein
MNLGQLLGGAGVVGQGMRQAEEAERVSRQNQLAIEEQNRVADLKQRLAGLQMPSFQPVNAAQFTQQFMPGQAMPMGTVPAPPPAAPAAPAMPAAPAAPAMPAAPAAPAAAVPIRPVAAQPTSALTVQQFQAMPPAEQARRLQIENDRRRATTLGAAAGKLPAAAADIFTLPITGGASLLQGAANAIDFARIGRAVGLYDPDVTSVTVPFAGSITPYSDKLRQAELANQPLTAEQFQEQLRTRPVTATAAPAQPTKRAQAFDNKVTPYDAIIQQSAQQYGIDPVVFKRLIGTESSFSPTAVSPRGEKFGLGIAQIAAVHGLSREQMLDPNAAIPFAAKLFSQYIRGADGNIEEALMNYKGASSKKGRAEMSKPIGDILSGLTLSAAPTAPGAAPAEPFKVEIRGVEATPAAAAPSGPPAPLEVPQTQARNMEMAEFYLANPDSIPYELQQVNQMAQQQSAFLTQQRNETAQLAQVYMRSGTQQGIEAAMRLRENIGQLDASLLQIQQQVGQKQAYLQGMQGLRELATANDPRRLSGVLTQFMGTPVGIQPRPDGNYNYFINGKKVQDGVSPAQLAGMALKEFSPEARAAGAQSAQLENELALKRKYGDAMVNAMRDIQKAMIDGEYKIAEERAKQLQGKLTIDTSKGVAYFQQGNRVFVINPDGKVEETPLGKVNLPPTATPVAGLNMGR